MNKEKLNIYQKLNAVMLEVKAVQKEEKKVNGQYRFVSHDAVAAALHMPLANNGIVMIPTVSELSQDGNRTVIMMKIDFVNMDDPNDKITVNYPGYGIDTSDKGIGKAISYAVKYGLLKTFCLETGDDVERDNIQYDSPAADPDLVKSQKKKILSAVDKEDHGLIKEYLEKMSKTYKKSSDEIVMLYSDINKFVDDFTEWKEKRNSNKAA